PITFLPLRRRQGLEVARLRVPHHLHAFAREILCEPGERQTRAVDGRLADDPLEAAGPGDEFQVKPAGLVGIKPFDRDNVVFHRANGEWLTTFRIRNPAPVRGSSLDLDRNLKLLPSLLFTC